jgi:hypothetical protein
LLLLALLFPLGVYCLILSALHRRPHPVLVPGTWDFVGVLFAVAGFLFVGGPAVISGFFSEHWRAFWWTGRHEFLESLGVDALRVWTTLSVLYFLLVVGSAAWILWRRRAVTCVYNVTPDILEGVLVQAVEGVGLSWSRTGNRVFLTVPRRRPETDAPTAGLQGPRAAQITAEGEDGPTVTERAPRGPALAARAAAGDLVMPNAVLDVDPFPLMRHASLRWQFVDPPVRQEVETELARLLARTPGPENPLGTFFLGLAALAFFTMLSTMGILLFVLLSTFP